jgi:non-SMC mitotic condensation complex subunit 1
VLSILGKLLQDETRRCVESATYSHRGEFLTACVRARAELYHQDIEDMSPLVRALALRTMSYIHVKEFVDGTVAPLKKLMTDVDPYVRKTAAFCVAKVYDHDKHLVEKSDLIDRLNRMLKDENPTVVASALASLMDIWERSESIKLTIDYASASKIVSILSDCSELVSRISTKPAADYWQMGSDIHPGIDDVLCTARFWRSPSSC